MTHRPLLDYQNKRDIEPDEGALPFQIWVVFGIVLGIMVFVTLLTILGFRF